MKDYVLRTIALCLFLALSLAACSKGDKSATQVVAKVNDKEISVHQVNYVLQRSGVQSEQVKTESARILDELVGQELMVQKATEQKLDRDPAVMQSIEAAKREILARAYAERIAGAVKKPSDAEIQEYYLKHPELFSERRIYTLKELTITATPEVQDKIRTQLSNVKSLEEMVSWLKSQNINYRANASVKTAEQVPMELLPKLHQMKEGQTGIINGPNALLVLQLASVRSEPIDEVRAKPFIERFLSTQHRTEAVQKEMKAARDAAKIEFIGEFAKQDAKDKKAVASVPSAASAPAAAPASAPIANNEIAKGIAAGIK